jgi:hypothetical protein
MFPFISWATGDWFEFTDENGAKVPLPFLQFDNEENVSY